MRFSDSDSTGGGISRNGDSIPGALGINTGGVVPTNNEFQVNTPQHADTLAETIITCTSATRKGLVVQGFASQSADIFEIQNSAGTVGFFVSAAQTTLGGFGGNVTFTATTNFNGPVIGKHQAVSSSATINLSNGWIIGFTGTTGGTLTLPSLGAGNNGTFCFIQDEGGNAGTSNIVIAPNGTNTINGVNASISITTNYGGRILYANATDGWFVLSTS